MKENTAYINKVTFKQRLSSYKSHPSAFIMFLITWGAAIITAAVVVILVAYILIKGIPNLKPSLFALEYNTENVSMLPAIINTVTMTLLSLALAVPIGVFSAIYLTEYAKQGKLTRIIEFTTETLAGIPSIIYGLFGSVFFYNIFKVNYSILTGALTLSIIVLPTIIRTTQEAIKTVPMGYREGAIGLGAAKWHTIRTVVLPSCIDGILTSVILSIGRIVGESAALIFTAGIAAEIGINSIGDIFTKVMDQGGSLTVQLYQYAQRGGAEMKYAFSTALVLLVTVLVINICAKLVAYRIRKKRSA